MTAVEIAMKSGHSVTRNHKKQSGFTLIELLVVMAILALLLAILLPTLKLAASITRQTVCLSNLRQLGIMAFLYSGEYDQKILPSARNSDPQLRYPNNQDNTLGGPPWYELLRETQGLDCSRDNASILHCPSDRRDKGYCSYSANRYLMGFSSPRTQAEQMFPIRKKTAVKGRFDNLILLGERGCTEEGDIGKVDGQWSMSGIGVSRFLGLEGDRGTGDWGFYTGRHSSPNIYQDGSRQWISNLKLPFLLLDGHAQVYKGQLDCTFHQTTGEMAWAFDTISVMQSPGGYWPILQPKTDNEK